MTDKRVSESRVTLTQLMGPGHNNLMGNVHGGVIMKLCDEAGGMAATKYARRPSVTVTVDSMTFHSPVHLGNLLTVNAIVSWVGTTSMETRVTVTAENVLTGDVTHTNTAYFVYVALGDDGRPTPVPRPIYETQAERDLARQAEERRALRLRLKEQEGT